MANCYITRWYPIVSAAKNCGSLGHPDRLYGIYCHRQKPGSHQRLRDRRHAGDAGAGHRQCGRSRASQGHPAATIYLILFTIVTDIITISNYYIW